MSTCLTPEVIFSMVNLAIDRGNSAIKTGIFDNNQLIKSESFRDDYLRITDYFNQFIIDNVIISSVVKNEDLTLKSLVDKQVKKVVILDHQTRLPFKNLYSTPQTLGKDRLAGVAGAQALFPGENVLIVDAGTAVTYDLILNGTDYQGGDIAPGLEMRLKALHHFTSRLPLVPKNQEITFPGKNTHEAISSGAYNGMIFEIEGYRSFCKEKYKSLTTILTGGDTDFLVKKLKKPIFADHNLVLKGLNRIMEYNA